MKKQPNHNVLLEAENIAAGKRIHDIKVTQYEKRQAKEMANFMKGLNIDMKL